MCSTINSDCFCRQTLGENNDVKGIGEWLYMVWNDKIGNASGAKQRHSKCVVCEKAAADVPLLFFHSLSFPIDQILLTPPPPQLLLMMYSVQTKTVRDTVNCFIYITFHRPWFISVKWQQQQQLDYNDGGRRQSWQNGSTPTSQLKSSVFWSMQCTMGN